MPQALLVIGAVSQVAGVVQQQRAAKAQQRQQEVATRESRRQSIRQAQLARASAISAGANLGAMQSSSLAGGLGSLGSQFGSQLGFSTEMSGLSRKISSLQQSAGMLNSFGDLAMGFGRSMSGGQTGTTGQAAPRQAAGGLSNSPYYLY
jgi:hypothetical protein